MTLGHCVVTQQLRPKERPGGVWRELRLGEVVELQRGYDLPRRQRVPGSIPLVPSSGVTDYHAWRADPQESPLPLGEGQGEGYADVPGFCKSATLEEVRKHGHVLTPGRYVGAEPQPDDGEPFEDKMARLAAQWREQQAQAAKLDAAIEANLARLGFGTGQDSRAEG